MHKVAIQVDQNDKALLDLALNNAKNVIDYYKEKGETVAIEIVAYGPGLHMLRADTSPVKERIAPMSLENPNLAFIACGISQASQSNSEGHGVEPWALFPSFGAADAGVPVDVDHLPAAALGHLPLLAELIVDRLLVGTHPHVDRRALGAIRHGVQLSGRAERRLCWGTARLPREGFTDGPPSCSRTSMRSEPQHASNAA